jgi:hypothetical protein
MADRMITISAQGVSAQARLNDSPTADKIWAALPITGTVNTWGDEIYFSIPVDAAAEPGASPVVASGDLAYWPPGTAFCIFFGPTPASRGSEIRAASAVNVFGAVQGDPKIFKKVAPGAAIAIEKS